MGKKKLQDKRLMIWDIESYLWKASTCCKTLSEVSPFVYQELYRLENGIDYINKRCEELMGLTKSDEVVVVVGGEGNFRKDLNPEYKDNRSGQSRPLMYELLKDWLVNKYEVVSLPKLEADDTCRIIYEDNENYDFAHKVIVSIDKDFNTIPDVYFYRDNPRSNGVVHISKEQADFNLKFQTIMGDKTDGYYGIPGWGRSKTNKWLLESPRTWADVLKLFQDNGLTGEDYAMNKTMAKLLGIKNYSVTEERIVNYD